MKSSIPSCIVTNQTRSTSQNTTFLDFIEVMKLPKCLIGPKMIRNEFGECYAYRWQILTDFDTFKFFKTDKRDDCGHLRLY